MIPLILKLKKARHKEIAGAQDLIVEELYKEFNNAVIHGGTAIWRCYQGNRFSEDVDVYLQKDINKINNLFYNFGKSGFSIKKKKISNSIFSALEFNRVIVRFEATFQKKSGFLREYETADGNFISVFTLIPEELIKEKINAYLKRQKVRDLYDIFFLLRHVKNKRDIEENLKILIKRYRVPVDQEELKILIIEGLVPSPGKMLEYIERWL